MADPEPEREPTRDADYTRHLQRRGDAAWKRWLGVQAPYRWNLRRLGLGYTLDVGCGIGRNLAHLDGHGVGVDHNAHSVERARERGLDAYTTDAFLRSMEAKAGRFDALLFAHVLEHMTLPEAEALVAEYLRFLRPGGKVVLITPQEAGYRSDPTHVEFMDLDKLATIEANLGLASLRRYSFPFPRLVGRVFVHNEFVAVSHRDGD